MKIRHVIFEINVLLVHIQEQTVSVDCRELVKGNIRSNMYTNIDNKWSLEKEL